MVETVKLESIIRGTLLAMAMSLWITADTQICYRAFRSPSQFNRRHGYCGYPVGGVKREMGVYVRSMNSCCRRPQSNGWGAAYSCMSCANIRGWAQAWTQWSTCSKSCGWGRQTRKRSCSTNVCAGMRGRNVFESRKCIWQTCCPVNGKWSTWSQTTGCSVSCGSGVEFRIRSCNSPSPSCGGSLCEGIRRQYKECDGGTCAQWASWTQQGPCSVTCGNGTIWRLRECKRPAGDVCPGEPEEFVPCSQPPCEVNGNWCPWRGWSPCSKSCESGAGIRKRARTCSCPPPDVGASLCFGSDQDIANCTSSVPCPVQGSWSKWSSWTICSAILCSRHKGIQIRSRRCDNPSPSNGGQSCVGEEFANRNCLNMNGCYTDGIYTAWNEWNPCSHSCGSCGVKERERACISPFTNATSWGVDVILGIPQLICRDVLRKQSVPCVLPPCSEGDASCDTDRDTERIQPNTAYLHYSQVSPANTISSLANRSNKRATSSTNFVTKRKDTSSTAQPYLSLIQSKSTAASFDVTYSAKKYLDTPQESTLSTRGSFTSMGTKFSEEDSFNYEETISQHEKLKALPLYQRTQNQLPTKLTTEVSATDKQLYIKRESIKNLASHATSTLKNTGLVETPTSNPYLASLDTFLANEITNEDKSSSSETTTSATSYLPTVLERSIMTQQTSINSVNLQSEIGNQELQRKVTSEAFSIDRVNVSTVSTTSIYNITESITDSSIKNEASSNDYMKLYSATSHSDLSKSKDKQTTKLVTQSSETNLSQFSSSINNLKVETLTENKTNTHTPHHNLIDSRVTSTQGLGTISQYTVHTDLPSIHTQKLFVTKQELILSEGTKETTLLSQLLNKTNLPNIQPQTLTTLDYTSNNAVNTGKNYFTQNIPTASPVTKLSTLKSSFRTSKDSTPASSISSFTTSETPTEKLNNTKADNNQSSNSSGIIYITRVSVTTYAVRDSIQIKNNIIPPSSDLIPRLSDILPDEVIKMSNFKNPVGEEVSQHEQYLFNTNASDVITIEKLSKIFQIKSTSNDSNSLPIICYQVPLKDQFASVLNTYATALQSDDAFSHSSSNMLHSASLNTKIQKKTKTNIAEKHVKFHELNISQSGDQANLKAPLEESSGFVADHVISSEKKKENMLTRQDRFQHLVFDENNSEQLIEEQLIPVRFVSAKVNSMNIKTSKLQNRENKETNAAYLYNNNTNVDNNIKQFDNNFHQKNDSTKQPNTGIKNDMDKHRNNNAETTTNFLSKDVKLPAEANVVRTKSEGQENLNSADRFLLHEEGDLEDYKDVEDIIRNLLNDKNEFDLGVSGNWNEKQEEPDHSFYRVKEYEGESDFEPPLYHGNAETENNCMGLSSTSITPELERCCEILEVNTSQSINEVDTYEECLAIQFKHLYGIKDDFDVNSVHLRSQRCMVIGKPKILNSVCCYRSFCHQWPRTLFRTLCKACQRFCKPCHRSLLSG